MKYCWSAALLIATRSGAPAVPPDAPPDDAAEELGADEDAAALWAGD
jgi:hypothetical protein